MSQEREDFLTGLTAQSDEDSSAIEEQIEQLAEEVVRRGLGSTVLFFLEAHRPLRGMLFHLTTISTPLFVPFFGASKARLLLHVMESDASVEALLNRIEEKSRESR